MCTHGRMRGETQVGKFLLRRVTMAALTLFIIATITFFIMFLVPGGPFLSEKISPAMEKIMMETYGFDKPLIEQYQTYITRLMKGDMGISFKRKGYTVQEIIGEKFPVSARVGGWAILLSILMGVPLGVISAYKRNKLTDRIIMFICTLGIALPSFVIATTLLYTFGMNLKWLPTIGLKTPQNYIMPVFALSLSPTCYITRLMRSSMLDVMGQDYLKTARSKGLSEFTVLFKHALRNSLMPVVTYLGPMITAVLTGSFIVERIFSIPGLGGYFINSINGRDYPMIMGTTIFLAGLLIVANLVVDVLYTVIDPRIKY